MKQSRELGYEGIFASHNEPDDTTYVEIAGVENAQGMYTVGYATVGPDATEGAKAWRQKYVDKYGDYNALQMIVAPALYAIFYAMEDCGSIDADKVKAELELGKEYVSPCLGEAGAFGGEKAFGRNAQWYGPQYVLEFQEDGQSIPIYKIPLEDLLFGWD